MYMCLTVNIYVQCSIIIIMYDDIQSFTFVYMIKIIYVACFLNWVQSFFWPKTLDCGKAFRRINPVLVIIPHWKGL